jgi:hypothetical protein
MGQERPKQSRQTFDLKRKRNTTNAAPAFSLVLAAPTADAYLVLLSKCLFVFPWVGWRLRPLQTFRACASAHGFPLFLFQTRKKHI